MPESVWGTGRKPLPGLLVVWSRGLSSDGSLAQIWLIWSRVNKISKESLKCYFALRLFSEMPSLL